MKTIWLWNHDATAMFTNRGGRHYWFAKYLLKKGYKPVVFCCNINHFNGEIRKMDRLYEVDEADGIPFVFIKTIEYNNNGIKRILNWISFYLGLFRCYKKVMGELGKPDIIVGSSVHPLTVVASIQIARRLKVPVIGEIRDLWPEAIFTVGKATEKSLIGRILVKGEHWMYKNADALIFTKEGDKDYLYEHKWMKEQGGDIDIRKCFHINNGVDYEEYQKQMAECIYKDEDLENDKFHVIYTGTLRKVNNVSNIMEAAAKLKEEKDIQFLIFGTGIMMEELKEYARKEKLENVVLKGYINKQYIPYVLSKSSVNLLNYSQELYNWSRGSSSNKLFEYMASGKPIISSMKMGYDLIERYGCGYSLEECTSESLAQMIRKVKNLPKEEYEQLGANAKRAAADFDFDKLTDKLIDVVRFVERG